MQNHDGVPTVIGAAEPTFQVRVVEQPDQQTMRLTFDEIGLNDSSDGIPMALPEEGSVATVAVVMPDLQFALEIIEKLARQRAILMNVIKTRAEEHGMPEGLRLGIVCWKRFRKEFPGLLEESVPLIYQALPQDVADAVVYRLRAFADMIMWQKAPSTEYYVYRME